MLQRTHSSRCPKPGTVAATRAIMAGWRAGSVLGGGEMVNGMSAAGFLSPPSALGLLSGWSQILYPK